MPDGVLPSYSCLLFAVGIIEDGRGETAAVELLSPARLLAGEAKLLRQAKRMTPGLPFDDVDVVVIDEMGKDISGSGFDTKVVGRILMPLVATEPKRPRVKRIVVRDLTERSAGNADGVGLADFITERLYRKIDREALYANALAGAEPEHARIPVVMATDREAIEAACVSVGPLATESLRLIRIRNTRDLEVVQASLAFLPELAGRVGVERLDVPRPMRFRPDGSLV